LDQAAFKVPVIKVVYYQTFEPEIIKSADHSYVLNNIPAIKTPRLIYVQKQAACTQLRSKSNIYPSPGITAFKITLLITYCRVFLQADQVEGGLLLLYF